MVFLVMVNSTSIVLADEELNQNDTDNENFVFNDSESITIRIEGIHSSSISAEKSVTESGNVENTFVDIIDHPLFILAIGAIITGFLIPQFAKSVQSRKESFEIKRDLIKKINSSTTKLLGTTQMLARQEIKIEEIPPEFLEWKESCAEIGATVRAYWGDEKNNSEVELEWNGYYECVVDLYNVITNWIPEEHSKRIGNITKFLKLNDSKDPKLELEYKPDIVDAITKKFLETVIERVNSNDNTKEISTKLKQKPKIQGSMPKGWSPENDSKKLDYSKEYSKALFELVNVFDKRKYFLLKLLFSNEIRNK